MGIYISLDDKKRKQPVKGELRIINPSPIWVGYRDDTSIKRYMPSERAEEWIKSNPSHKVRLHMKKFELDQL